MNRYTFWVCAGVIGIFVLNVPTPAYADIYQYKDKDGKVVFSDKPPSEADAAGVEEVQLGTTNSAQPPPHIPPATVSREPEEPRARYSSTITSPADGSTIPMGPGNFAVTAVLSPPLNSNERALLKMDGEPVGEPQRGSSWQLRNVFRGEHQLTLERYNASGQLVDTSVPVTVYVMRPSIR